jgi:multiple sugar transport system substrate-binding protein
LNNRSRRRFLSLVGVGTLGALAVACGGAPSPTPAKPADKPAAAPATTPAPAGAAPQPGTKQTELTYWASWTGLFEEMVKRIANAFMAKNPDIKVNHLVIPAAEMDAKILTGVAAANPPDVAMIWGAQRVYTLADQGALHAVEDALDKNELGKFKEWVYPPIWELGTYKGKTYAIAQWCQSYCMIWNAEMVDKAGLPKTGPATTTDLFEWAMKLSKKSANGDIDVLGYYDNWPQRQMSIFGGKFYDEASDKIVLDAPENLETVEYMVSYTKQLDPKKLADYQQALKGAAQGTLDPLLGGKQAMVIQGPWHLGVMQETKPDFKYGVAQLPVKQGRPRGWWTYGDIPSIIKNGKNIPASGRYVTFLTGFGGEEEYASLYLMPPKGGGRPHNPISRKLLDSPAWKPVMDQYPGYDQFMKTAFGDETKFILTPPKIPVAAFLDSRYRAQVDKALLGEITPKQALDAAQKESADEYAKYKQQNPPKK